MPSKNIIKQYIPNHFYHVYNRGVGKQLIFRDDEDYSVFLNLLKRHLSKETILDPKGREYVSLSDGVELNAYCLMPNHYHLLLYLKDPTAMTSLLRRVCGAYSSYYNKKHKRVGHLFQDRYKALLLNEENQLLHLSRYIHLNPSQYEAWPYSSYQNYIGTISQSWVCPSRVLEMFDLADYADFCTAFQGSTLESERTTFV